MVDEHRPAWGSTTPERATSAELLPLVYNELRSLAASKLAAENPGHTLQPTALVHEVFVKLSAARQQMLFATRADFMRAAAEAMRRILVDQARTRRAAKRGGQFSRTGLENVMATCDDAIVDLLELNQVLDELHGHCPDAAELIKLRFFAGFGHQEAASALGLERRTADRLWQLGRTWLYRRLKSRDD